MSDDVKITVLHPGESATVSTFGAVTAVIQAELPEGALRAVRDAQELATALLAPGERTLDDFTEAAIHLDEKLRKHFGEVP